MKMCPVGRALVGVAAALTLLPCASQAAQWLWQADNHEGNTSRFTDPGVKFTFSAEGGAEWVWDDPAKGSVSYRSFRGWMSDQQRGSGLGVSSDFGEAFDLNKGITVSARVKPTDSHSYGAAICISINNSSTADLPGGSAHIWVGWALPDKIKLRRDHRQLKELVPTVDYNRKWCVWTLSGKKIGADVAWDLWIDCEHQTADQRASDGSLHTLVASNTQKTDPTRRGNTVSIGSKVPILEPHDAAWDYVAITNDGVIPGWDGGNSAAKAAEPDTPPTKDRQDYLDLLAIHKQLVNADLWFNAGRYADVVKLSEEMLAKYEDKGPTYKGANTLMSWWLRTYKACSLFTDKKWPETIRYCGDLLREHPDAPEKYVEELKQFTLGAYTSQGRIDEAIQVLDSMIAACDERIASASNPVTIVNAGFEDTAAANDAPGWIWYNTAVAGFHAETSNPHSGSRCLVFTNASETAPEVYGRFYQGISVFPSTQYELSLWVRGEDVAPGNHLTDWGTYTLNLPEGTFGWKQLSTQFTTKPEQTGLVLGINVVNKCDLLVVDDIMIRPVEAPVQFVRTVSQKRAGYLMQKAHLCQRAHRVDLALKSYGEVRELRHAPDECKAEATYQSGMCYREKGLRRSAEQCMELVMKRYPDSQWARTARGMLHVWSVIGASPE